MQHSIWAWVGFNAFVLVMLAIDLGIFNREAHVVRVREAAAWSAVWITLAMVFAGGVYYSMGSVAGLEFLTGYLIEKALSVDNIFVFVLLFSYFGVPPKYQHRVLFWGVLGALLMRGAMIGMGAVLIARFEWIIYLFGAFLVFTGIRMVKHDEVEISQDANPALRLVRRFMPITEEYHGQRFFVREPVRGSQKAKWVATPLFVVLVLVETTDLIFAVDSIPAVFAVTRDPFLVYTSNIFAILGLRSLYFLLAGVIHRFHYLKVGIALVLMFVGVKMLISGFYHVPVVISLGFIASMLGGSVALSLLFPKAAESHLPVTHDPLAQVKDPGETESRSS